jgi:hypothetical protein
VSKAQAYAAWKNLKTPDYEAESGHPADIHYGRVTDDDYGSLDQNGQDQLRIVNRLIWILTFKAVPCASSGGGGATRHPTVSHPADSGFCTETVLVDATSGATLLGFEDG